MHLLLSPSPLNCVEVKCIKPRQKLPATIPNLHTLVHRTWRVFYIAVLLVTCWSENTAKLHYVENFPQTMDFFSGHCTPGIQEQLKCVSRSQLWLQLIDYYYKNVFELSSLVLRRSSVVHCTTISRSGDGSNSLMIHGCFALPERKIIQESFPNSLSFTLKLFFPVLLIWQKLNNLSS